MKFVVRLKNNLEITFSMQFILSKNVIGLLQTDQKNHLREQTIANVHNDIQEMSVAEDGAYLVKYCVDHLKFGGKHTSLLRVSQLLHVWLNAFSRLLMNLLVELMLDSIDRFFAQGSLDNRQECEAEVYDLL